MMQIVYIYTCFVLTSTVITGYIIDSGRQPECWGIECQNNGYLDNETCTCSCPRGYMGLFCETELKHTEWPVGRYSILSTVFGCPETDDYGWHIGYVNMTLAEERPPQRWKKPHPTNYVDFPYNTADPHLLGPFTKRSLQLNFCTRNDFLDGDNGNEVDSKWPPGDYCVFKYGPTCPTGFVSSHVTLGEYHLSWTNTDGVIPDVTIQNGTFGSPTFYFCCHDERSPTDRRFPNSFSFIMIKTNQSSCTEIEGMTVSEERFDFVDDLGTFQFETNTTVLTDTGDGYQRLELCYYSHDSVWECMFEVDGGFSYRGHHNTSINGNPCIHWYEVKEEYGENFSPNRQYIGDFDHNYCRTYWPWGKYNAFPWCSVYVVSENGTTDEQIMEPCSIPLCEVDPTLEAVDANKPVYSGEYASDKRPQYAVDGVLGLSFVAKRPQNKQWIQVDLEENLEVHAVFVQRSSVWFPNNFRFPGVYISKDRWNFVAYGALQCTEKNFPRRAHKFWFQCYRPIVGQYVTIRNFDDTNPDTEWGDFYILEIKEITVYYKRGACSRRLGLISGGIRDFQLGGIGDEAGNTFDSGRLYGKGPGWCYSHAGPKYFEVDTIVPTVIQGFELQGSSNNKYNNVKEVTVEYGIHNGHLQPYLDANNQTKIFKIDANGKADMVHRFLFYKAFVARYFRLNVTSSEDTPVCMKMEVIGCPKRIIRDVTCTEPDAIDVGFEVNTRTGFWMESAILTLPDEADCLEACEREHCLTAYHARPTCSVLFATRYNPHYFQWVVNDLDRYFNTFTRLCITDVRDYTDCDVLITEPSVITSPLYPNYYGQLAKCSWNLRFPPGKYPRLQVIHLDLPPADELVNLQAEGYFDLSIGECRDTLSLEGFAINAETASDFQNSLFISSSENMTLTLKSCARYSKPAAAAMFKINVTYSDIPGCGFFSTSGDVMCTSSHGMIAVPGFPTSVPLDTKVSWTIQGQRGQYVRLMVKVLYLPDAGPDCRIRSVTLEDKSLQNEWMDIGRYCAFQKTLEPITSSWHTMRIIFESGPHSGVDLLKGSGFMAEYELIQFVQDIDIQGSSDCPEGWEYHNNSCYKLFNDRDGLTWIQAEQECVGYAGHLVSFQSRTEVNFIHYLLTEKWTNWTSQADFYIGLKKSGYGSHYADYQWSDGAPATFLAWYGGTVSGESQPNGMNNELCTFLRLFSILSTDNWHDVACAYDSIYNYICETRIELSSDTPEIQPYSDRENISYTGFLQCGSGEMTQSVYRCDGMAGDCFDTTDEFCQTADECPDNGFRCNQEECIASYMLCNFVEDCSDGADEIGCIFPSCNDEEWQCTSGQCIPRDFLCDVKRDCIDGSDEEDCSICQGQTFQCYDQRCVTKTRVCDSFYDCTGRFQEDEVDRNCTFNTRSTCSEWYALGKRSNGTYLINLNQDESFQVECRFGETDGNLVVETLIHHDMESMVAWERTNRVTFPFHYSASDSQIALMKQTSRCQQYIKIACRHTTFWLRWVAFDGTFYENRNKTDTCDCPYVNQCSTPRQQCNCQSIAHPDWYSEIYYQFRYDEGYITNQSALPIKQFNLPALDSSFLTEVQIVAGPLMCVEESEDSSFKDLMVCKNGQITPVSTRCVMDMDSYEDIVGCRDLSHLENCEMFECPSHYLKCPSSYCIPTRYMCDGIKHCPNAEDEDRDVCSDNLYCSGLYRCRGSHICLPRDNICDSVPQCPQHDDEAFCTDSCPQSCECAAYDMTCSTADVMYNTSFGQIYSHLKSLQISAQISQINPDDLIVFPLLNSLNISRCGILELVPFQFNNTLNLVTIDIRHNKIFQIRYRTFYGLVKLRALFLKGNPLIHLDPFAFSELDSLTSLDLSEFAFDRFENGAFNGLSFLGNLNISRNGIKQVKPRQFETLSNLRELDIRGNDIKEFDKEIFYGLASLQLLYTDSFTLCCVRPPNVLEENCWPAKNEFSSCDDLMKNEILRVAVWIIGIAAFIGNTIVLFIRFYIEKDSLGKTYSIFVSNLSIADLLMGIYLIIIAVTDTVFRGSYVWNDYSWRTGDWCKMAGVLASVGSEGSVLFLCLITLDRLLVVKFPFGNVRITKYVGIAACVAVWIIVFALAIVPLVPHPSFYSRSAVCLALPLTRDKPEGWQYSVGVYIVFNFLAFVLIATAQIVIYLEISSTRRKIASRGRRMDMAIARKLFFVAITDFLCWFPVGLMGILALRGHVISGEVYAWIAVFVLPINSAINPFLYTLGSSFSKARSTIRSGKRLSQGSIRDDKTANVTEVFDSELFLFGNAKSTSRQKVSLDEYLGKTRLNPKEAYTIVLKLCRALELLHSTEMVHGAVGGSSVMITRSSNGKIKRVVLKSSPKFCTEEAEFKKDISDVGEAVKLIIRNLNGTK